MFGLSLLKNVSYFLFVRFEIRQQGGSIAVPACGAFLLFPAQAVSKPVILKCERVRYKDNPVKPRKGETFCSRIIKMEPEGLPFAEPVTVLLSHSAAEDGAYADYYDLTVQKLTRKCDDLETERFSKPEGTILS